MSDSDLGSSYRNAIRQSQRIARRAHRIGRLPRDFTQPKWDICETQYKNAVAQKDLSSRKNLTASDMFLTGPRMISNTGAPALLCPVGSMDWREAPPRVDLSVQQPPKPMLQMKTSLEGIDPISKEDLDWVKNVFA